MAISDLLSNVGSGLAKAGKASLPVLERTADVVSGQAPQLDEENRKRTEKLEDEQINAKAAILESQLQTGQKYGTLSPEQQQQYVDAITGLYSHPRHAGKLVEKLRQAIHPNGTVATGPTRPLPNTVPEGGTAQADEQNRERALVDALSMRQAATDEEIDRRAKDAALYHKPAGKSPPVPGNQLPLNAIGPDGQPIPAAVRTAAQSFSEWNGVWYSAPKPKPIYKIIKGHVALMDPNTGLPMRDLGLATSAKFSTRQTPVLGSDGLMHLMTETSVTTPEAGTIEVEAAQPELPGEAPAAPSLTTAKPAATSTTTPKIPAKKVGSLLPKSTTSAKPVGGGVSLGPPISGSEAWANTKNPIFKSDVAQYTKAAEAARDKKLMYQNAQGLLNDPSRQTDLELVFAWVRSNVQGAGRMTNTEINQAAQAGSWGTRIQNAVSTATTGRLAPELEQQFLNDIKRSYENAQNEADSLQRQLSGTGTGVSNPPNGGQVSGDPEIDDIVNALRNKK